VADGEDDDLFAVVAIEGDVCSLAEFDDPLAELGQQVFDGAADLGVLTENFDAQADGFDGTAGGVGTWGCRMRRNWGRSCGCAWRSTGFWRSGR
jgi:hypothetical protein